MFCVTRRKIRVKFYWFLLYQIWQYSCEYVLQELCLSNPVVSCWILKLHDSQSILHWQSTNHNHPLSRKCLNLSACISCSWWSLFGGSVIPQKISKCCLCLQIGLHDFRFFITHKKSFWVLTVNINLPFLFLSPLLSCPNMFYISWCHNCFKTYIN